MNPSTFATIASLLDEKFQVEAARATPETTLEQLGLDSLALMEFVFAVEDKFDVRIPEDRLDPRQAGITLERLAALIDEAVAARPAASAATSAGVAAAAAPRQGDATAAVARSEGDGGID